MKLIILDRDGVINKDSVHSIKSPEEWVPIEGSLEAISLLNKMDILWLWQLTKVLLVKN